MRKPVKTGIAGIDKMSNGGIPEGNQVLVAGGPGAGKSLLCFEFLYRNAKEGNVSAYFSLEEDTKMVIDNAKEAFPGFKDVDKLIEEEKLIIKGSEETRTFVQKDTEGTSYTFGKFVSEVESQVSFYNATRVAIDSISLMRLLIRDPFEYRNDTMSLINVLKRLNVTSLLTTEIDAPERSRIIYQPEFFIYDGLILMSFSEGESENRTPIMEIIKMRGSNHSLATLPYEITPNGINILFLAERKMR